jgi:hypothetical protein
VCRIDEIYCIILAKFDTLWAATKSTLVRAMCFRRDIDVSWITDISHSIE